MYHKLKKVGLLSSFLFATVVSSSGYAATLNLVTKYGDSGGYAGDLNEVGDQVNGNNICPAANDYNNAVPGCDMSADVQYNDNGTPNIAADDYPEGDLIVRTNDLFNVSVGYSWLGNAGGAEEQVTLTGTLPAGKGFVWEGIPGSCDQALSTLSPDGKTISCVRKDFDTNNVGSFAEDMAFPVRVEGDAANGSVPGDISFTITDPTNSTPDTDGVEDGNTANLLKITAAPRWNIDKHGGSGYYYTSYAQVDDQGNPGWFLWYNFTIEVDEVTGTADSAPGRLGNEALQGGTNATVSFVDDLSNISPNAKLVTWSPSSAFSPTNNACDMDTYTNSDEPYPSYNATYPDRSIQVPAGTMGVTCIPDAVDPTKINVTVTGVDGTLTKAPIKNRIGGLLPVNRAIAAIGVMRVFVPVTDVELGADGLAGTADDGSLLTTNCLTDFNPVGISGGSNFGNSSESTVDNCRSISLFASRGSWSKSYRKGWSDQAVERAKWGGGGWSAPPTDASLTMSGDGTVTPGSVFGTYNAYTNTGGSTINNPVVCDVIDVETFDMTVLDPNTDNPGTFLDDTKHAVDLNYSTTETVPGLTIEYATGYVGNWPPNPNESPRTNAPDEVVDECGDPSIVWYPDYVTAAANGPVSKVKISAPTLPAGKQMSMRIKHTARSTYLSTKNGHTAGAPIENDELLINHGSYKSALTDNKFRAGYYIPHDASTPHQYGWSGDRLIMVRAKARILKEMSPVAVSPGSDVTVTLTPSFTTDGPLPETENLTIKDLLPKGLTYTNGSTTGSYGDAAAPTAYTEPQIISPVTDADCTTHAQDLMDNGQACGSFGGTSGNTAGGQSLLIWNLGNQVTGTVYESIVFHSVVDVDAPAGTLANYTLIESPADSSNPSKRIANANINDSVPSSLLIVKSVQTPLHEVNTDPLLNWMQFRVGLRNGSLNQLTELDVIDILPFNGDGTMGSFTFTPTSGTTVGRARTPASNFSGSLEFGGVSFDNNGGQCTGSPEFWYTKSADTLDISPLHTSNDIVNGSANWCQGDATGPTGCGFTNTEVTAVRVRGVDMNASGTCFVNLTFSTKENLDDNIYSNTAGAKAIGVSNGVLSNTVSAKVYASSIGDKVWFDTNTDGIQDANEIGIPGVVVKLLDANGTPVKDPANPANDYAVTTDANGNYKFDNLVAGDYQVKFELGNATITSQNSGNDTALDSDADSATGIATVTLGNNEDKTDIDAGITSLGSIGNYVWIDADHDGIQDPTEVGIDGITVTLLDGSGNPILDDQNNPITTTTSNGGAYLFTGLIPGDYSVGFSNLPAGYEVSLQNQGTDAVDSDASTTAVDGMFKTDPITLGAGEDNLSLDAGIFRFGTIGDTIWNDKDNDGVLDAGEGLAGVTVELTKPDGTKVTAVTDANGKYLFNNLLPGDYTVAVVETSLPVALQGKNTVDPSGAKDSTSTLTLGEGASNLDQDFAYFAPGSIGDTIWNDKNNDGVLDAGEALAGVTVELTKPDGTKVTATTDANGKYLFEGLLAGDYTVAVVETTLPAALQGKNTVDPIGAKDSTSTLTLGEGENNLDQDFAYFAPATIGDTIWNDKNNDGVLDAGEALAGVTVELTKPDGTKVTDVTDANGKYLFEGLLAGDYTVAVVETSLPAALQGKNTVDPSGAKDSTSTLTLGEGASNLDQDFAYFAPGSIGDTIWNDKDNDGVLDAGEGLAGVTVELTKPDGTKVTTTTDANGKYLFEGLLAGDYTVAVVETTLPAALQGKNTVDPSGAKDSTSTLTLGEGASNLDQDFAYFTPGSIGDTIWNDKDNDGVLDAGEGLAGVTVELTKPDGTKVTTTTDANGKYLFEGLLAGDYTVAVVETSLPAALQGKNTVDPSGAKDSTSTLTLGEGASNLDQDFAYFAPGSIGDTIWNDKDNDGVLDAGEGLAGVTVELTKPDGTKVTATTDANGKYLFESLVPGDYTVAVVETSLPAALQGKNTVDPSGAKDSKSALTLGEGASNLDQDFAYFAPASIGDTIWNDKNNDGVLDAGEGLAGVTVELTKPDGTKVTAVTDANGNYLFESLLPGDYTVAVIETTLPAALQGKNTVDPSGAKDSKSTLTLGEGASNLDQDFAYFAPATIGDTIWNDKNNDGVLDAGEALAGVTVELTKPDGTKVTAVTDANGKYLFESLVPGDYTVAVIETTLPAALQGNNTVDPSGAKDSKSTLTLGEGASNLDQDFAYFAPSSIGDKVWLDANQNGIQDDGESGVDGVTVTLYDSTGNVVATTVTANGGEYSFDNLDPGTYTVGFTDLPVGFEFTSQNQGSDEAKDSDVDTTTGKTAPITVGNGETITSVDAGLSAVNSGIVLSKTAYGDDDITIAHDSGAGCGTSRASDLTILVDSDKSKDVPLTYCFKITNNGETYLTDVSLEDSLLETATGNAFAPTLLSGSLPLAPNASLMYYTEVVLAASLNNTATVKAKPSDSTGTIIDGLDPVEYTDPTVAKVALIIDPPSAVKTVTPSGAAGMQWQMVWINDSTVNAPDVVVFDEVPVGTSFSAMAAGANVSASGVYCETRGASTTNISFDANCYFEAPTGTYPRGRVVWKGVVASDPGLTTEAAAANEVVIRFVSVLDNPTLPDQSIDNQATSEWDFDNDPGTPAVIVPTKAPTGEENTVFKNSSNAPPPNGASPIPTLSEWALLMLMMLLGLVGYQQGVIRKN